jgi:iron-sulfur cluster insertion protein
MNIESRSISLSSSAIKRIQGLLPDQKSNFFRVYVTGGGCSGFQYGFKFDNNTA